MRWPVLPASRLLPLASERGRTFGNVIDFALASSTQPSSAMVSSTRRHRVFASSGRFSGSPPSGERINAASIAPCSTVNAFVGTPKYVRDATSMPKAPRPK